MTNADHRNSCVARCHILAAGAATMIVVSDIAAAGIAMDAGTRSDAQTLARASSAPLPAQTASPSGTCPAGMALVPPGPWPHPYPPSAITPATHAFCMDILETTHADYAKCVRDGHCTLLSSEGRWASRPRYPVLRATFEQAASYCRAQNKRVPSPNEWVRAAGGDEERDHPWGNAWPKDIRNLCTGKGHPCNVGTSSLDVSQFGIRDMALNAQEWVLGALPDEDRATAGWDWWHTIRMTVSISREGWHAGIRCAATPQRSDAQTHVRSSSTSLPDVWLRNDFGVWAFNLRRNGRGTPYYIHTTPEDEAAGWSARLGPSHGCIHIRPSDRDKMIRRHYLEAGVELDVKAYDAVRNS